jgi:hypothetical protein
MLESVRKQKKQIDSHLTIGHKINDLNKMLMTKGDILMKSLGTDKTLTGTCREEKANK